MSDKKCISKMVTLQDPDISDYTMVPDTAKLADSPRVCLQVVVLSSQSTIFALQKKTVYSHISKHL